MNMVGWPNNEVKFSRAIKYNAPLTTISVSMRYVPDNVE